MTNVEAFKKHVLSRQLNIAQVLGKHFQDNKENDPLSESAFAIMHLCMQYFEMIGKIYGGDFSYGKSPGLFNEGFKKVFPHFSLDESGNLYSGLRCAMFHSGIPARQMDLDRNFDHPISLESGLIRCNPRLFAEALIEHFKTFCDCLQDDVHCDLQDNFERFWESIGNQCRATSTIVPLGTPNPSVGTRNPTDTTREPTVGHVS